MKIIAWQNYITPHQIYTWREVERNINSKISFILDEEINDARRTMGWSPYNLDGMEVFLLRDRRLKTGLKILRENPRSIHVFRSIWGKQFTYLFLILFALSRGIKVAILIEPYSQVPFGYYRDDSYFFSLLKVVFRPLLYKITGFLFRIISKGKTPCLFAISKIAQKQLTSNWFESDTIFPFGYFIPKNSKIIRPKENDNQKRLKLIFLGSLIKRKGIDIAIKAIHQLTEEGFNISLDIYGPGILPDSLSLDLLPIRYKGTIPLDDVQEIIALYDMLIVPSRHDGWGVVVNEALIQGVPVIASDHVGAGCILEESETGIIFKSENVLDLVSNLRELIISPTLLKKLKRNTRKLDDKVLAPKTGGDYFTAVLKYYFFNGKTLPELHWK